jgi:hypothetical protein
LKDSSASRSTRASRLSDFSFVYVTSSMAFKRLTDRSVRCQCECIRFIQDDHAPTLCTSPLFTALLRLSHESSLGSTASAIHLCPSRLIPRTISTQILSMPHHRIEINDSGQDSACAGLLDHRLPAARSSYVFPPKGVTTVAYTLSCACARTSVCSVAVITYPPRRDRLGHGGGVGGADAVHALVGSDAVHAQGLVWVGNVNVGSGLEASEWPFSPSAGRKEGRIQV